MRRRHALLGFAVLAAVVALTAVPDALARGKGGGRRGGKGRGGAGDYEDRKSLIQGVEERMRREDMEGRGTEGRAADAAESRRENQDRVLGDQRRGREDARRARGARVESSL